MGETSYNHRELDWWQLIETALSAPGHLSNSYSRFRQYSFLNQLLLLSQGIREPVNTLKRWNDLGRTVLKGSKAAEIVRPITITKKNDAGEVESTFTRFKFVRCLFTYSQTEGEEIAMPEVPEWSLDRALEALDIKRVPYTMLDANASGYSYNRNLAISPVDEHPLTTAAHEIGHILLGHTTESSREEYIQHRGLMEFGAESVAYLTLHELGLITEEEASESRGYIQHWLRDMQPSAAAVRQVFTATDRILRAGRLISSLPACEEEGSRSHA
jgi:antirestriction protein ArdC